MENNNSWIIEDYEIGLKPFSFDTSDKLARTWAETIDRVLIEAMQSRGWNTSPSHVAKNVVKQTPYTGLDRFFYKDGYQPFLEIRTTFNHSLLTVGWKMEVYEYES